jgi:hypothetical protein
VTRPGGGPPASTTARPAAPVSTIASPATTSAAAPRHARASRSRRARNAGSPSTARRSSRCSSGVSRNCASTRRYWNAKSAAPSASVAVARPNASPLSIPPAARARCAGSSRASRSSAGKSDPISQAATPTTAAALASDQAPRPTRVAKPGPAPHSRLGSGASKAGAHNPPTCT